MGTLKAAALVQKPSSSGCLSGGVGYDRNTVCGMPEEGGVVRNGPNHLQ